MIKTVLLYLLIPLEIFGQDFSGVWTGYITTAGNQLSYELVISETGDKLTGYSRSVFTINGVENIGIKTMKVKSRKGSISIEDDDLIYNNYTTVAKRVTLFSTLTLEEEDSLMILQGSFFTRSVDRSTFKGTIRLEKAKSLSTSILLTQLEKMNLSSSLSFIQPKTIQKEPVSIPAIAKESLPDNPVTEKPEEKIAVARPERHPQPVSFPNQKKVTMTVSAPPIVKASPKAIPRLVAAELASRKTEIIRTIFFQSDSLILSLYDNGQVDGDTVSVVVNDQIIIARQGLSTNAATTTVYTAPGSGDSLRLVMYAENLGSIPPNTGLLIIQDGDEKYQIRFEGDFQKNSAIILRRKR